MIIKIDTDLVPVLGVDVTYMLYFLGVKYAEKEHRGLTRTDNSFQLSSEEMYSCGLKARKITDCIKALVATGMIDYALEKQMRTFRFGEDAKAIRQAILKSTSYGSFEYEGELITIFTLPPANTVTAIREWVEARLPAYHWDGKQAAQAQKLGEIFRERIIKKKGICSDDDIISGLDMMVDHSGFPKWLRDKWDIPALVSHYNKIMAEIVADVKSTQPAASASQTARTT